MMTGVQTETDSRLIKATSAYMVEVFSSIQGEGTHVGRRHIFTRFFACNLRCHYCDTPESLTGFKPEASVETVAGSNVRRMIPNPVSTKDLAAVIAHLNTEPHDAVSLTGGEPLLQASFIASLAPMLSEMGLTVYLETNGTLPDHLMQVIDVIDIVSMDIKLPETLRRNRDWSREHAEFLKIALAKEAFCKLVLPHDPDWDFIDRAATMVAQVSRDVPFILQPLTPFGTMDKAPDLNTVTRAYETVRNHLRDVRVIPQTHKMIGLP